MDNLRKQFNPFPEVSCAYGAPMGRRSDDMHGVKRLHARRQGGGEGYDKGGAYWGTPSNVWGVWGTAAGETVVAYVRASSRADAITQVRAP